MTKTKQSVLSDPVQHSDLENFDLSIEACLDNLPGVRNFVSHAGKHLGLNKRSIAELCMAVDEAVTNVIVHGYKGQTGKVELRMAREDNAVIIQVLDHAETFDASHIDEPQLTTPFAQRASGGMGVYLIRQMTDEAEYLTLPGGGNELRLVKRGEIP